ncbi:S-adenosyl-L-methionine-dependent methyltransferase [Delitschia confertaspora ATCC 74209]|uniref:S-adenosyl-L-methionine-dependent methyltransferase n=1 Tax=Delitschia confertaspora ATCC 74209 TaxID=1513339 RepID=A0A9P4MTS3_9PLEO|nr:S-adenosyl-L-methionine-dependent methyltransferase [Delitschia confertaspora ATCC 74209]
MSSVADANRKFFDAIADSYESNETFQKLFERVLDVIRSRLDWLGVPLVGHGAETPKEVRMLDYACGTGMMSRALGPYVTSIRGMDISPKMVDVYNRNAKDAGVLGDKMFAIEADIFYRGHNPEVQKPEYFDFDIIAVGFAFHHFENARNAARDLYGRLRPGGALLLTEFLADGDIEVYNGEDVSTKETKRDEPGVAKAEKMPNGKGSVHHQHGFHHYGAHHHNSHDRSSHDHGSQHHTPPQKPNAQGPDQEINTPTKSLSVEDLTVTHMEDMNKSISVPSFSVPGVTLFLMKAGFVDIDVSVISGKFYMEFGGKKMYRTALLAKGRKPTVPELKSHLGVNDEEGA